MGKLWQSLGAFWRRFVALLSGAFAAPRRWVRELSARLKPRKLDEGGAPPAEQPAVVFTVLDAEPDALPLPPPTAEQGKHRLASRLKDAVGAVTAPVGRAWMLLVNRGRRLGTRKLLGAALALVACLAFLLALINAVYAGATRPKLFPGSTYRIDISGKGAKDLAPFVEEYVQRNPDFKVTYTSKQPDVLMDTRKRSGYDAMFVGAVPPLQLKAGNRTLQLRSKKSYWLLVRQGDLVFGGQDPRVTGLAAYLSGRFKSRESRSSTTLNVVGDIIPGRHVTEKMATYGVDYPFRAVAPLVRGADVAFGDLECPLTDRFAPPTSDMLFSAPTKTVQGLKTLGLNVVSVANNHTTNFGVGPFTDTLKTLTANGIKYCGGGYNYDEAHSAAVVDVDGDKFGFLSYNTIPDTIDAHKDSAGIAWISMPPFYKENPEHFKQVATDIAAARQRSDFVVASFHWSKEDVYDPSASMKKLAHQAIDAGADMVIGGHPHSVQPIEIYKGKLIAYSLGNFVFDQMQRDQTREGFFLKCQVDGDVLTAVEMVPYMIYDYSQPVPFQGDKGQYLLDHVLKLSGIIH